MVTAENISNMANISEAKCKVQQFVQISYKSITTIQKSAEAFLGNLVLVEVQATTKNCLLKQKLSVVLAHTYNINRLLKCTPWAIKSITILADVDRF